MARIGGYLTDIPDPRDDGHSGESGEGGYPEGQGQDPTLSRDAEHSTYATYPSLPGIEPPSGDAATQTLGVPTDIGGGA